MSEQETEPEVEDNTQVDDAGVPGQIQYPDREVDAERAAAFAGGKEDSLYEDESRSGWQNPADNVPPGTEERVGEDEESDE